MLANKALKEPIIGEIKFEEPKSQGMESLQDVMGFLEIGDPPSYLTKGEWKWLVRNAVRYCLIDKDLYLRGQDQVLRRFPIHKRKYLKYCMHVMMDYVVGILLTI